LLCQNTAGDLLVSFKSVQIIFGGRGQWAPDGPTPGFATENHPVSSQYLSVLAVCTVEIELKHNLNKTEIKQFQNGFVSGLGRGVMTYA